MVKDNNGSSQPKGIENYVDLLRKDNEPKGKAIRHRLKAMACEALHSHTMPDELARALLMSTLQDCRRALDGKVVGATAQFVAETLDTFSESLTRTELKAIRNEGRSSS